MEMRMKVVTLHLRTSVTDEELGDSASVRSNSSPKDYSGGGYDGVEGEVEDLRDTFLLFLQCRCYT